MVVHIKHYDKEMAVPLFMERTINVFPTSYAYFDITCPTGECDGSFTLLPVISAMVKGNQRTAQGKMDCPGNGIFPAGHASITYKISIEYKAGK